MAEAETVPIEDEAASGRRSILAKGMLGAAIGVAGLTAVWLTRKRRASATEDTSAAMVGDSKISSNGALTSMNGNWKPVAATVAGVGLALMRFAELRQLRRINRSLVAANA